MSWFKISDLSGKVSNPVSITGEHLSDMLMSMSLEYDRLGKIYQEKTGSQVHNHYTMMARVISSYWNPTMSGVPVYQAVNEVKEEANKLLEKLDSEYDGNIRRLFRGGISRDEKESLYQQYPTIEDQFRQVKFFINEVKNLRNEIIETHKNMD